MSEARRITGHCLCGAVTVTAQVDTPILRACHCDMCRKHTGGPFMSISVLPGSLEVSGPAKSYRSSEWAERGFCTQCGSTLWYGTVEDGLRHPAAGLFDEALDAPLKLEFYAEKTAQSFAFAGSHRKLTEQECIELFGGSEADA